MSIPPDQYELYAEFGIAAEKAQVLEVEAGNVALMYLALFVNTDQISTEQREMFEALLMTSIGRRSENCWKTSSL